MDTASLCTEEHEPVHKEVGETAEFSVAGCVKRTNVIRATWNFVKDPVAVVEIDDNGIMSSDNPQFKGRVDMNTHNFTLTITSLTHQDSGKYSFVSVTDKDDQNPTIFFTLYVNGKTFIFCIKENKAFVLL